MCTFLELLSPFLTNVGVGTRIMVPGKTNPRPDSTMRRNDRSLLPLSGNVLRPVDRHTLHDLINTVITTIPERVPSHRLANTGVTGYERLNQPQLYLLWIYDVFYDLFSFSNRTDTYIFFCHSVNERNIIFMTITCIRFRMTWNVLLHRTVVAVTVVIKSTPITD